MIRCRLTSRMAGNAGPDGCVNAVQQVQRSRNLWTRITRQIHVGYESDNDDSVQR